jgi:hypothetical protein
MITTTIKNLNDVAPFKIDYTSLIDGWLNTRGIKMYSTAQKARWMSENASEGSVWSKISPAYQLHKLRKYAAYPGGGRKLLIASGNLFASMLPPNQREGFSLNSKMGGDFRKLIDRGTMIISTSVPYAEYVDRTRNFTTWSKDTIDSMKMDLAKYIANRTKRIK